MSIARALCLAGPTASGKTVAALAFAAELPVEIISVDSALVYRGMDIGTAKSCATERHAVPHRPIDIIEPNETHSAARFVADARRLIAEIRARGAWEFQTPTARPSRGPKPGLMRAEVRDARLRDGHGRRVGRSPTVHRSPLAALALPGSQISGSNLI
jgi:hypothetical protein